MRIRAFFPVLAFLAFLVATSTLAAQDTQEDRRPGIAAFPFENGGSHGAGAEAENFEGLEVGLQQLLLVELSQNTNLRVVERSRIRDIMAEQDLLSEGRVDPQTAARIGKIVGARYVILGSFLDLAGDFHMTGRVVDTETSEWVGRGQQVRGRRENIYDLLVDLASDITEGLDLPLLPAPQREARKEREIPPEAITLYSRAQVYEDAGRTEQAITLYRRITEEFPDMTEAQEALRQLTG